MEYDNRYQQVQMPQYDCLLFDLDDTLYPFSSGLAAQCSKNIQDYMNQKLGIPKEKLSEMCNLLYKNYGTTMAGLRAIGYDFDYDDYHSFVHGRLPYEKLKPDPVLRNLLLGLPLRKVIFTNADKVHAAKVLGRLGLEDCFEGIICFETLNPKNKDINSDEEDDSIVEASRSSSYQTKHLDIIKHFSEPGPQSVLPKTPVLCKPSEAAFKQALKIANIDPKRALFFDDSVRNIEAAKCMGIHTVLVGISHRTKGVDYALESIHNIREALPELWEANDKSDVKYSSGKVAIETSVTA
ncbi:hypothetical protein Sjap_001800 [Stephania japonica]|uniref:Uncharacterized protein n=1 Tax=Stephania japonica TaxID=461633 RepID=A0AAP0KN76_9MAGN